MHQSCFHALHCIAAEGEIKQSSHGLKCSALFTRPITNKQGVDWDSAQEGLKEVEALDGLRGNEENEQGKQNVRALEEETMEENRSWETGGREVRGEQDKTRDHLHRSSLTISECC